MVQDIVVQNIELIYGKLQVSLILNCVVLRCIIILLRDTMIPNFILPYIWVMKVMSIWVFWTQIHCLVGVEYYIEIYWFVMYFIILSILCIVMLDGIKKDMMFDLKSFDRWTLHTRWHPILSSLIGNWIVIRGL